jgi:hypothetical protein
LNCRGHRGRRKGDARRTHGGHWNHCGHCGRRRGAGRWSRRGRCGHCDRQKGGGRWNHRGSRRDGGRLNWRGRCGRRRDDGCRCRLGGWILRGRRGCPRVTGRSWGRGHRGRRSLTGNRCRGAVRRRGGWGGYCGSPGPGRRRAGLIHDRVSGYRRRPSEGRYCGWLPGGYRAGSRRRSRNCLVTRGAWAGRAWSSRGCRRHHRCGLRDGLAHQGGCRNGKRRLDGLNADRLDDGRYCPSGHWTDGCPGGHLRELRRRSRCGAGGLRNRRRSGVSLGHGGLSGEVRPGQGGPAGRRARCSLRGRCHGMRQMRAALRSWASLRGARSCRHRSGYRMFPVPQTRLPTSSISTTKDKRRGPLDHCWERPSSMHVRRCPTLPRGPPRSTIGAEGLNFRVRNGTGCFPYAITAETLWRCTAGRVSRTA